MIKIKRNSVSLNDRKITIEIRNQLRFLSKKVSIFLLFFLIKNDVK